MPKTYNLKYPITVGEKTITSVTLKRLTAGDLRKAAVKAQGMQEELVLTLTQISTGLDVKTIDKMDIYDFIKIQSYFVSLLEGEEPNI